MDYLLLGAVCWVILLPVGIVGALWLRSTSPRRRRVTADDVTDRAREFVFGAGSPRTPRRGRRRQRALGAGH